MRLNACLRPLLIMTTLLAASMAQPAAADGAVMVKGGAVLLSDDIQLIDNVLGSIDESSTRTFAVSFEHRNRRGMSFGIEYTDYRHDYTTVVSAEDGDTRTQILQFIVRKYFFEKSPVRPLIGLGIGGGYTHAEFRQGGVVREDDIGSFVLQGALGAEFRIENLSLMLEVKRFWHEPGSSDDYNATATGVFGGVGFNW